LLAPALQHFLGLEQGGHASGRMTVTRAVGRLRKLAGWALGIPPAGDYDLLLEVVTTGNSQCWLRHFGNYTLRTVQTAWRDLLIERKGLASVGFELSVEGHALLFKTCRAWILGVPVPLWLSPCIEAGNWPNEASGWRVRVTFRVPLLGRIAEYEGSVLPP